MVWIQSNCWTPIDTGRTCYSTIPPDSESISFLPLSHSVHTLASQGVNSPSHPSCTSGPTWFKKTHNYYLNPDAIWVWWVRSRVFSITSLRVVSGHFQMGWMFLSPDTLLWPSTSQSSHSQCGSKFLGSTQTESLKGKFPGTQFDIGMYVSESVPAPKQALFWEGLDLWLRDEPGNAAAPPGLAADQPAPLSRNLGAVAQEW